MSLANQLTLFRIGLIPIFIIFLSLNLPYKQTLAAIVFSIAAITDGLDGHIARSRKEITNLGKIIDPLADKLLVTAAFIMLVELGLVRGWVVCIILARELSVTGLRVVAAAEGHVIAASFLGKLKTISQTLAIIAILLQELGISFIAFFSKLILYFTVAITAYSGIDYVIKCKNLFRFSKEL